MSELGTIVAQQPSSGEPAEAPATLVEPVAVVDALPAEPSAAAGAPVPELKPHTDEPGFLSGAVEAKAPDAASELVPDKPADAPGPEPGTQAEKVDPPAEPEPAAPPEPVTYEPPALPDGITLDAEQLGVVDTILGKHRMSPEARQELVDWYVGNEQARAAANQQAWHDAFGETRRQWAEQVKGDEEIGGAAYHTNQQLALRAIRTLFPKQEEITRLETALAATGAIDNPEIVRAFVRMGRFFAEPAPAPPNPNPAPDAHRGANGPRSLREFRNHPRSQEVRRVQRG